MEKYHLYIHFPYCLYKCHYCDFNSHAWSLNEIPHLEYAKTLEDELKWRHREYTKVSQHFFKPGTQLESVFFGGGTPSLMRPGDVETFLEKLTDYFSLSSNVEITLESNPGTVDLNKFKDFKKAGINRVSLGIQSLMDKNLKRFGRIHTADDASKAIRAAQDSGIERVSCDLIFGFPDQSLDEWSSDLQEILSFNLKHISCYALTAEPDTIYTKALRKNLFKETDADVFADMQELTYNLTDKAGMRAYEISNFAGEGQESQHNLGYWQSQSFLGLGAGAWSNFVNRDGSCLRTMNVKMPAEYTAGVQNGAFYETEDIDRKTAMTEFMMMGLRLRQGISHNDFMAHFGIDIQHHYKNQISQAQERGWLELDQSRLKPTRDGFLHNNSLVQLFMD